MRRTWALKGKTPIIASTGSWKTMSLSATLVSTPKGNGNRLFLRSLPHSVKWPDVIAYVKALKIHMRGKKLLLFWDGLSAHKAGATTAYLKTQRSWLRVERFPSYAPEVNPTEYLWSVMKNKHLCNLRPDGLPGLKTAVCRTYRRVRNDRQMLKRFLNASGLYGS